MIAIAQGGQRLRTYGCNCLFGLIQRDGHPGHKQLLLLSQQLQGVGAIQCRIADQITALLRGLKAAQVAAYGLGKGFGVVTVATEGLHIDG